MGNIKRAGAILMLLGLLSALFGCAEDLTRYGEWQSFRMNRISSVRTDAYHFSVSKTEDGEMTVSGYCFDGETEYRTEQGIQVSENVRAVLTELDPAMLPTRKGGKSSAGKADGAENTAIVTHTDGTERSVSLTPEKQAELVGIFREELISAVRPAENGGD